MSLRFFKLPGQREDSVAACFSRGLLSLNNLLDNIIRQAS